MRRKSIAGSGNSQCKGPEVRISMGEEAMQPEWNEGMWVGDEGRGRRIYQVLPHPPLGLFASAVPSTTHAFLLYLAIS